MAADDSQALRISVLGPLELAVDGEAVEVPGAKRRAVLALLAMAAPEAISTDRLVDAVWPEEAPVSGRAALQSHVSRLRRHLGACATRLTSTDAGYRLALGPDELDATRFEAAVRAARSRASTDPVAAAALLVEARGAWRGPPLAELADVEPLAAWCRALTETWLDASDLHADCALRGGDPAAGVEVANEALAVEPLRETSAVLLVRALAAQGRTADAMRAAHDFRTRLVDETGLDPSSALTELEQEVAAGEGGALSAAAPPPAPTQGVPSTAGEPLVGRDAELAGVTRMLATERLITLVGPGGVGKTRLATEVARRATPPTEVSFLALASVTDPAALPDALSTALGVEAGRGDPLARCIARFQRDEHLLVVDNCEHLIAGVREMVTTLLTSCPELTVLATSRERLAVSAEQTSRLAPLPMPTDTDPARVEDVPSVALFLDRARRARPELRPDEGQLRSVAHIVRALDGMPLAIELAAGRLSALGVEDLESRLDRALDLLAGPPVGDGGADGRHRTLRAAVEWSYDLLPEDEQRLFRHLAVFPGGFDLATAETVAADLGITGDPATSIGHLVDSSMLVADLDGAPRYRMLDTLRSFGLDRLDATGELDEATDRLLRWATDLTADIDATYNTEDEARADRRLRSELANLRTAWRTARDRGDLDAPAAMVVDLYSQALWRDLTELFRWFLELADDPALEGHPREAQVLGVAAEAAWASAGDLDRAETLARRSFEVTQPDDELGFSLSRWALADVMLFRGRFDEAGRLAIESREGTPWAAEGYAQSTLAAIYSGDLAEARRQLEEAKRIARGPAMRAYTRYIEGEITNFAGEWDEAIAAYCDAIDMATSVGASFIQGISAVGLVTAQARAGAIGDALAGYLELIDRWETMGAWTQQWTTLRNLADLLEGLGDESTADALRVAADEAPEASAVGTRSAAGGTGGRERRLTGEEALVAAREAVARALARTTSDR